MTTNEIKIIAGALIAIFSLVLSWFVWLKQIIYKEVVKPHVDSIVARVDALEKKDSELEQRLKDTNNSINKRFDQINESILALTRNVSELTGQLKILFIENKK